MAPLPKLIGQYDSPFVRRVGVALVHYGIPFEHVTWSVWRDAELLAQYNPLRRVPTFVLGDGSVLVESFAILEHLDEQVGPARALLPPSGPDRRLGLHIAALATGLADKAVSLLYERLVRDPDRRSEVWVQRCSAQIRDTLALLETDRARRNSEYWLGTALSHADIAVACVLRFIAEAHPQLSAAAVGAHLRAHAERCEALPELQQIVQPLSLPSD